MIPQTNHCWFLETPRYFENQDNPTYFRNVIFEIINTSKFEHFGFWGKDGPKNLRSLVILNIGSISSKQHEMETLEHLEYDINIYEKA